MPAWLKADATGVTLEMHIQPGAKKSAIVGPHGDALKVRLAAPPVDGKANAALIALLAERLALGKTAIELVQGHSARRKRLHIAGVGVESTLRALMPAGD